MKRAVALGLAASLLASGTAYSFWGSAGTGSGTARTATVLPLTLTQGSPTARLYPGGTADVAVSIANPNPFQVRVAALKLDTSQGSNGFAVDGAHSGCGLNVLTFAPQSNNGDGWMIPANNSLAVALPGSITMSAAAANTCQAATFTVYLAATVDNFTAIRATSGLISFWRLGTDPVTADNFTGTAGSALSAHAGTISSTWTTQHGTDPILSTANRLRRGVPGWSLSGSSVTPASADYAVQADVVVRSIVAGDALGVVARLTPDGGSYYSARYQTSDGTWRIYKTISGTDTSLASSAATLTPGQSYRLRLDLIGGALTLSVDGVVRATASDSALTSAGRAGLQLGVISTSVPVSDTTGLHGDNFRLYPNSGTAGDSTGSNNGTYLSTVVQNEPGALAGDLNGAVTLTGASSAMRVPSPAGLPVGAAPRTVELWFKRTGTTDATLFSYGTPSPGKLFAAHLTSATNLRVDGNAGSRDFTTPSTDDGAWHHAAVVYDGGTVQVYLDGVSLSAQSLVLNTALDASGFTTGLFAGSIDDVALYGQALSAATVQEHYRVGHGT